ncbi:MAG: hypothetical protein ACHP91_15785, partial [Burkholderiales bacterium]
MKASLQVRLSQHLALTPQLQQSIRLLQLSTLELHQEIEQMMEQNPFLEPEEESAAPEAPFEAAGASTSASAPDSAKSATDADADGRSSNDNVDEPAGVDPIAVIEIQRIIGFLKARGIGVLITDHNVR